MAKKNNDKKKNKLGVKGAAIAVVVAILSLLGFGWNGMDWGQGNLDSNGQQEQVESETNTDTDTSSEVDADVDIKSAIYVYENKAFLDQELTQEITFVEIEDLLINHEGEEVYLYDAGAIKQTYDEVENIFDKYDVIKITSVVE